MQMIDQSHTFQQFTLLKVPLEEIHHMIKDLGLLHPSTQITKAPNKLDGSIFCKFHNTNGHTIAQCRDLKNQVEDFVRNRYLDDFIEGSHPVTNL